MFFDFFQNCLKILWRKELCTNIKLNQIQEYCSYRNLFHPKSTNKPAQTKSLFSRSFLKNSKNEVFILNAKLLPWEIPAAKTAPAWTMGPSFKQNKIILYNIFLFTILYLYLWTSKATTALARTSGPSFEIVK